MVIADGRLDVFPERKLHITNFDVRDGNKVREEGQVRQKRVK